MLYDANARLATLERPQVKLGALTCTGILLSIEQWEPFEADLAALQAEASDGARARDFAARLFRAVFPRPRWRRWIPDPVPRLLALPWALQVELALSFVRAQRRANGIVTAAPPKAGSSAPSDSPPAPADGASAAGPSSSD